MFTSEERKQLISVGQDRTLRIWDIKTKNPRNLTITSVCVALDLSPMDTTFATGHKNGDLKLWSLSDGREIKKASNLHSS